MADDKDVWVFSEKPALQAELIAGAQQLTSHTGGQVMAVVLGAVSVGSMMPTTSNGSPRRVIVSPTRRSCWRARSEPRTVTLAPSSSALSGRPDA